MRGILYAVSLAQTLRYNPITRGPCIQEYVENSIDLGTRMAIIQPFLIAVSDNISYAMRDDALDVYN